MLQTDPDRLRVAAIHKIDGFEICFESEDGSAGWLQFRTALFMGQS